MSDMITGDAVVLELRIARLASRAVAFAIDLAVMITVLLVLFLVAVITGALNEVDEALGAAIALVLVVGVLVVYPVTIETLTRGRSLGKLVLGLRVVREDGGPIRFRHALARGLAGFVVDFGVFSFFSGAVGLISSMVSTRGRRVGDILAGTVVVRERMPSARAVEIHMPPPLARWASALELSALPDPVALSARQFLVRAPALDPRIRGSLALSLAGQVSGHVTPVPPPGTPPEAYLAAVLAERRRREEARLRGPRPVPPAQPMLPGHPMTAGPWPVAPTPVTSAWAPPDKGPTRNDERPVDGFTLPS